jgi:signal peptidase I
MSEKSGNVAKKSRAGGFWESFKTVIYAVVIATMVRTFAYEPFHIPSESMVPTLLVGDYLFVSKFSYGYSRYSFPFGPALFSGRILSHQPQRGDIVVFKLPRDNKTDYIKRLIGLPGDHIQMRRGVLYINGEAVPKRLTGTYEAIDRFGNRLHAEEYIETLPNGVSYRTIDKQPNGAYDNTDVYVVPADHYFFMGDNRDGSADSRILSQVGYVPAENLVGRAEILFFSTDGTAHFWEVWKWPFATRFARIGDLL